MSFIDDLIKEGYVPCLMGMYKKQNEEKIIQFFNELKQQVDKELKELNTLASGYRHEA